MNSVSLHDGDTMGPDEVKVPKSPDEWAKLPPNTSKGDPTFYQV